VGVGRAPGVRTPAAALVAAAVALLALAALWPALSAGFVHWDDDQYVFENPAVVRGLTPGGVAFAFTSTRTANWHPLTWLSHELDVTLHGLDPRGHHLSSLLLHAVNAALLFAVLRSLTGALWRSALAAALFAAHPLHVESAAWVSERKDLLAALCFLLALGAWARYARRPGPARYAAVAALFALGLLAKPMVVTLPGVLLLLDLWPLGRVGAGPGRIGFGRALREQAPLLALAAASGAVTLAVQRGAMAEIDAFPLAQRLGNALVSYARYLGRTVSWADLSCLVPLPDRPWAAWQVGAAAALLAALLAVALAVARSRPWAAVGWLWYLGTLVPVIGLVQVGRQALADRYTYLPLVGVFVVASWAAGDAVRRRPRARAAVVAGALALVALLAGGARRQAAVWRDDVTLFGNAVRVDPANWQMQNLLGAAHARAGRTGEALRHFRLALDANPRYAKAWYNLGNTLEAGGRYAEALPPLERALALRPDYAAAHASLGAVLLELGRAGDALAHLEAASRVEPGLPGLAGNLEAARRLRGAAGAGAGAAGAGAAAPGTTPGGGQKP
jgi:tetratricopeptide (TPR) repeat protein